jgi:hypothetical protein
MISSPAPNLGLELQPSRPPISTIERDLRWTVLAGEVEQVFYRALQADAFGTIDDMPLAEAGDHVRALCRNRAEQAVRGMSVLVRQEAERKTKLAVDRWLRAAMQTQVDVAAARAGHGSSHEVIVESTLQRFISDVTGNYLHNLTREVLVVHDEALLEPLGQTEAAQHVRGALIDVLNPPRPSIATMVRRAEAVGREKTLLSIARYLNDNYSGEPIAEDSRCIFCNSVRGKISEPHDDDCPVPDLADVLNDNADGRVVWEVE